jgi:hypothetical protein
MSYEAIQVRLVMSGGNLDGVVIGERVAVFLQIMVYRSSMGGYEHGMAHSACQHGTYGD